MATMYGADVQQLTDLANAVDQAANQLSSTRQSVNGKVQQSAWVGPVADKFRSTWSSSGNSQVASAAQLLTEAATTLRRNAAEQTQASSASVTFGGVSLGAGGAGGAGGGGGGRGVGGGDPLFEKADGIYEDVDHAKELVDYGTDAYKYGWAVLNTSGWSSMDAFESAADWGIAEGPKWIGAISDFMDTPGMSAAGTALGVVGAGFAVAKAVETWTDPKSTTWNKTETTVGAALAVGALIPGPQEPFVAVAAVGWAAGTWIADNHVAIGQFASDTAVNIGKGVTDIGHAEVAGVTAAAHVAAQAVNKGEQVVGDLSKDVTGFFSKW